MLPMAGHTCGVPSPQLCSGSGVWPCWDLGSFTGQPAPITGRLEARLRSHVGRKQASSQGELEAACKVSKYPRL